MIATQAHPLSMLDRLQRRRHALGISYDALGARSGVSVATVKRLFSARAETVSIGALQAVASALGGDVTLEFHDAEGVRETQARRKAERLVRLVQGGAALEGQAVTPAEREAMVERTVRELLTGPRRRLWAP